MANLDKIDELYNMKCNLEHLDSRITQITSIIEDVDLLGDNGFIIASGDIWAKGNRKDSTYQAFFEGDEIPILKIVITHLLGQKKKILAELKKHGFSD